MSQSHPVEIFQAAAGHYEWADFRVYRHPRFPGQYHAYGDTGCSCSWYEPPTFEELEAAEPLSPVEVRRRLASFLKNSPFFSSGATAKHLEDLQSVFREEQTRDD